MFQYAPEPELNKADQGSFKRDLDPLKHHGKVLLSVRPDTKRAHIIKILAGLEQMLLTNSEISSEAKIIEDAEICEAVVATESQSEKTSTEEPRK
jgi:hypothetical protein